MKSKVVLLTNILSPYRIPLFNRLSQDNEFDFKVVALAENEANRQWQTAKEQIQFHYRILPGWHSFIWRWEFPIHLNWGLRRILRAYKPDIVITSGYDNLAYWESFLYAKLLRKPFILCNESTLLSTTYRAGPIGMLKRFIIRHADAYIAFGKKSREYLEAFGAKSERIFTGIDTVDMDSFRRETRRLRNKPGFRVEREKFPSMLLLFTGQLIPRKGVARILRALAQLRDPEIGLLIAGGGPEEKELERIWRDLGLRNIYVKGYVPDETLLEFYALADVFILPSLKEVWGLVVNEALASGLYVLCSNRAGAAYDLIQENWNGGLFNPNNAKEFAILIRKTKEQIEEIRARREAISEHACQEFSIEHSAKAFLDAIEGVRTA